MTVAVRIHLGHHFYGAGNLGDDFMLAGFLAAARALAPEATFTACVPFDLGPLRKRFPAVDWQPCDDHHRAAAIAGCDAWLGLGGSPFQSALSRWFIDHLAGEAALCARHRKRMFFLGVGVQNQTELSRPEVRRLITAAAAIWTRDPRSAEHLQTLCPQTPVAAAADLAHLFFRDNPPPPAPAGRVTLVVNFDFQDWPAQETFLAVLEGLPATDRVWLAQESRALPGAERDLFTRRPATPESPWRLIAPEIPGAPLPEVLRGWPSGGWLVTSRYHAALAGAWAGSRVVVIGTNEKLAAAARDLGAPLVPPDAGPAEITAALARAPALAPPAILADQAFAACVSLVSALRQG